jgi:glucosamine 6-phosphate synthetase-like amidotransferase/phosphosugar isomerase protein
MNQPGFAADIADEPAVLDRVAAAYAGGGPVAAVPKARRVLLTGMGSSMFAARVIATRLRACGLDAYAELASTADATPPSPDLLCIAITASGGSAETVEALARHAGTSRTVAVTNAPDRLGDAADAVLPLVAGPELGGISCKTFCATLAVLGLLADHLTGARLDVGPVERAAADGRELLAGTAGWVPAATDLAERAHTVYAIGPVERISSALEAALMFREGPRVAADACETGDWLHVDVYLSKHPGYTALLFGGSRYDGAVMEWARQRSATILAIGRPVEGAAMVVPVPGDALLVETMAAELVANELWRRRVDAGAMP